MKKIIVSSALLLSITHSSVFANENPNNGLYSEFSYETFTESNVDFQDIDLSYLSVLTGYKFNRNLSVEGFIGNGNSEEVINIEGISIAASLGTIYGIALKTEFDVSDTVNLYAKLKYASFELKAEEGRYGIVIEDDTSDLGVSFGMDFKSERGFYGTASISLWGVDDETTQTGFKIGLGYKF